MAKLLAIAEQADDLAIDYRARLPLTFDFAWNGATITCQLSDTGGRLVMILIVDMGNLPFSAENPGAREKMLRLSRANSRLHSGTFHITSKGRLHYHDVQTFTGEVGIITMLSVAAQRALMARPAMEFVKSLWA